MDLSLKLECDSKDQFLHTWQEENIPLIWKYCKSIVNQEDDSSKKNVYSKISRYNILTVQQLNPQSALLKQETLYCLQEDDYLISEHTLLLKSVS